jgi:hypothetical protein
MSIANAFLHLAPEMPDYKGKFRAVYFEPISGSGERFTIGIIAQSSQGEFRVIRTLPLKSMICMYGKEVSIQADNLVSLVIESAKDHLNAGLDLEIWSPPLSGVKTSKTYYTQSKAKLDGILFQAITSYASLYKGKLVDNGLEDYNNELSDADDEEMSISLVKQVKTLLSNECYNNHWNKEVIVKDNSRIYIDYLGSFYNANLSNFNIKKIKSAYDLAKGKLFDLELLRDKRQHEVTEMNQEFELLVALKSDASSRAKDLAYQLEELADSRGLNVVSKPSAELLAKRIHEKEAA